MQLGNVQRKHALPATSRYAPLVGSAACAFAFHSSFRSLFIARRICPTLQPLCLPFAKGGDLGKEFEQERKTREEMDRIFDRAAKDMKAAGQVRSWQHSLAFTLRRLRSERERGSPRAAGDVFPFISVVYNDHYGCSAQRRCCSHARDPEETTLLCPRPTELNHVFFFLFPPFFGAGRQSLISWRKRRRGSSSNVKRSGNGFPIVLLSL